MDGPAGGRGLPDRVGAGDRTPGPSGGEPVDLDTTLYLPAGASSSKRVPAVLLAHGFGGTKDSVRSDAEDLVARGYAVLTWTARGFGRSGGQIHLDNPDYEVRDAQRLLDRLAERPDIRLDAAGDPGSVWSAARTAAAWPCCWPRRTSGSTRSSR
ncbi:alpha/beta hydrolase [Micromonospora sp. BRA006-A]|nr:alpha/beta hydrolase [Micromonospora sp. BRA006-A]